MKKNNKMLLVTLAVFFLAGIIIFAIALRMAMNGFGFATHSLTTHNSSLYGLNNVLIVFALGLVGLVCVGISVYVFFKFVWNKKLKGQAVVGVVTGYEKDEKIEMNGVCPFKITGTFVNPFSNTEMKFISSNIWESEDWFKKNISIGDKADVIVKNEKKYKVDVDSILRYKGIVEF